MTTVGLCVPQLGEFVDRSTLRGFVCSAEQCGFASLWVQEHLFYPLAPRSGYAAIPALHQRRRTARDSTIALVMQSGFAASPASAVLAFVR